MVCLFFNITRQVAIFLFTRGRRSSLHQWTTSTRVKLPRGLPFHTEMSSTVYPHGCGWERDGSMCAVCAPLLFVHVPHLRGCVRQRYKPRHNASSIPMPLPSPTTSHHHAPLLLTLSLIFLPPFLYTRPLSKL